ncbi:NAD-glutamate dehydrogenase [Rhodococcus pyridinivorans]|uniref:NAD-glutamate dehydrogenase domain-containing protein n=1 Tax=Rhodococcus pyridinivorans TaxID=103816 RepID=UPI001E4590E3|nr:NAD-glutamate dehydrogenase domain-containing protein [Rhodococcus pyridinivorans]MCD5420271.1 NAD-glutamate dehydrogenase [Rhodococcus pyridinivorans]
MVTAPETTDFTTDDWNERFLRELLQQGINANSVDHQLRSIPPVYKIATAPREALTDLTALSAIAQGGLDVHLQRSDTDAGRLRLRLRSRAKSVTLSQIVPILHGMDLEVLDEHAYSFHTGDNEPSWIYDIGLRIAGNTRADDSLPERIGDTIHAIWAGHCEADGFNTLVTRCGLTHQQANLIRAYAAYLRQLAAPYTTATVRSVLLDNPRTTTDLVRLFTIRFDPDHDSDRDADATALVNRLTREIDAVTNLDADRILRAFLSLIQATLRTNFFQAEQDSGASPVLAFKIDTAHIDEAPQPRPAFEIFVYSPRVEGVHLRFAKVARGGLRWSDRRDDYRTEILGLAKAQSVKNAVIVPAGAKGGFVTKPAVIPGASRDRNGDRSDGITSYRAFIDALLSVTDNLDLDTRAVIPPHRVVRYDDDDSYLVVAADKGTATFSDHANAVARERGFWLGDAFASGGSIGYDHKKMGITARGAWESVKQHFRELDHDVMTEPTTVVGIGDMSGDVFGNGMLLSPHLKLVAAFDHRHIFVDPDPDPTLSYTERARLFALGRSSWSDYDSILLSRGGFIVPRTTKRINLTPQARDILGIDATITVMTPNELISAILTAPVDLLWNGGIGTYAKATTETHAGAGDKTNDPVRVNADQLRARVIGEGGNLGLTQRARIEYARAGGRINTDALDNSAGVDCSDHEVNIKIVLDSAIRSGTLDPAERTALLDSMTDEVADLVLADNRHQNELMSVNRNESARTVALHARLVMHLQNAHGLDRAQATLPGSAGFRALEAARQGLTSPELAQLTAHVKLALKSELVRSSTLHSDAFTTQLVEYFPTTLSATHLDEVHRHPLRHDILATAVVNEMVNTAGITFAFRLREETGADGSDAATAFVATTEIFGIRALLDDIHTAESDLPLAATLELRAQTRRLIDRGARWLLANRPQPIAVDAQIRRYRDRVSTLTPKVRSWLHPEEAAALDARVAHMTGLGAPEDLASRVAELLHVFCLLDISDIADITGRDVTHVADLYFALSEHLRINYYLTAVTSLPHGNRWDALARLALREELYAVLRAVVLDVFTEVDDDTPSGLDHWMASNHARLARASRLLAEMPPFDNNSAGLPTLSVAVRRIRSIIRTPEPQS